MPVVKKISKKELNKKAVHGARVVTLQPAKESPPTASEVKAAIARLEARHSADFAVLADAIEKTSSGMESVYTALLAREKNDGASSVELRIYRGSNRLVRWVDVIKTLPNGSRKHYRCPFKRDDIGNVHSIEIKQTSVEVGGD